MQILLHELKRNQEYRFYITALGVGDIEEDILNLEMWSEFTSEIVKNVRGSLATTKSSLSRCKCLLFQLELNTVKSWAMRHSMSFSKVGFDSFAFLTTVADIFVHILHPHHMCNGLSDTTNALAVELENIFNRDFCPKDSFGDGFCCGELSKETRIPVKQLKTKKHYLWSTPSMALTENKSPAPIIHTRYAKGDMNGFL